MKKMEKKEIFKLKKKMQEKKELEEKAIKEAEERERIKREEEERQRKIEFERQMEEERIKKIEQDRISELSSFGIKSVKDIEEMNKNLQKAEDELKKQGFQGGIEEMFSSLKQTAHIRKNKKKPAANQKMLEEDENENQNNKGEEKEENVDTEKKAEANVPISEEFAKLAEKEIKFEVNNNAEGKHDILLCSIIYFCIV